MNTLREDLVVWHGVENIAIITRMSEDIQRREGDCQAKKTRFWEKYGDVAQLLFVKLDDALLKAMVHFWDPTYRCFTFNEVDMGPLAKLMGLPVDTVKAGLKDKNGPYISWSDIRDAMGKASNDRHLSLLVFAIYGLIVFPKALGYVSVFVPSTRPIEEFLESEKPPNQSIEECVQNLSTLTYQEIEWRALWMIRSTVIIWCDGQLWVPLIGIWGAISYSSLIVLSQYGGGSGTLSKVHQAHEEEEEEQRLEICPMAIGSMKRMTEMMTTMVKGKAKVGEGSGTLNNPIYFYGDIGVYHEDLPLQVLNVTIRIPRVNELPASEERREVDKGNSIMDEDTHKFSLIEEHLKAIEGLGTFGSV
ncbi:hypothetical protein Godav_021102 [Gossypium davidsonii]|uniref:DUF7745 domain-containing protein n=1 Tax=Gossypium davidsonii TaxID=34287 RepID=A0A7J8R531_GOSDV|nr:hypothetical protein [Gossypium davidsonii]